MGWFDDNAPNTNTAQLRPNMPAPGRSLGTVSPQMPTSTAGPVATAPGPGATTATTAPSGGNLRDPTYAAQLVAYWASQPGANPSLARDPNYWIGKITSGELGPDEKYIISKFMTPEGAPAGSLGGMAQGGPFPGFVPPTGVDEQNDPGYQFRLAQGTKAINTSAAARGTLLTGGTMKDLTAYAQGLASNEYGNVFNRALQTNQQNFGINQGNFQNMYNLGNWGLSAARNS